MWSDISEEIIKLSFLKCIPNTTFWSAFAWLIPLFSACTFFLFKMQSKIGVHIIHRWTLHMFKLDILISLQRHSLPVEVRCTNQPYGWQVTQSLPGGTNLVASSIQNPTMSTRPQQRDKPSKNTTTQTWTPITLEDIEWEPIKIDWSRIIIAITISKAP